MVNGFAGGLLLGIELKHEKQRPNQFGLPACSPLARLRPVANKDLSNQEPPLKPMGEAWLYSEQK